MADKKDPMVEVCRVLREAGFVVSIEGSVSDPFYAKVLAKDAKGYEVRAEMRSPDQPWSV